MGGLITEKIDNVTRVDGAYASPCPPAPKSVKIELSPRCNLRCGFCALRTREKQPKQDMEFALFQRITEEMRDAGVEEIGLFYLGESTSNPELLVKALRHVKDLGFGYVFLTTNGTMLDADLARDLFIGGLDSLKFSMNAADEEQYEKIMGVKGRLLWDAVKNLQTARIIRDDLGARCGIFASSIQYDGEQGDKMQQFLSAYVLPFVDQHYWLPLYSMGSLAEQREKELGYRPTAGNQGRIGALRAPLPCWSAFTEGHVRADGGLSACCFGSDDRFDMGNLATHSFAEAWNSPKFQALRMAHLNRDVTGTVCEKCIAY